MITPSGTRIERDDCAAGGIPVPDGVTARRMASALIGRTERGRPFAACDFLAQVPGLSRFRSAVLELAYEEYARRTGACEDIDPHRFAAQFGEHRSAILEQIAVHNLLAGCFEGSEVSEWPAEGEEFLGFQLQEELGRGAFSRVFRATQEDLGGRTVVVKVCPWAGEEARLLGKLEHPHIVPVHSISHEVRGLLSAICMPFLGRSTLRDVIDRCFAGRGIPQRQAELLSAVAAANGSGRPAAARGGGTGLWQGYVDAILQVGIELSGALESAHARGILHADLKPSNVLVTEDGRSMLLDFNLSREAGARRGPAGGTLPYMAPEQWQCLSAGADVTPTPATDVHALGATLYEALAGRGPFGEVPIDLSHEETARWLLRKREHGLFPLRVANPAVNASLARLVEACLHEDPARRPGSAAELNRALSRELGFVRRAERWGLIHKRATLLAAALVLGGTAAVPAYMVTRPPARVAALAGIDEGWAAYSSGDYGLAEQHFSRSAELTRGDGSQVAARAAALFGRGRSRQQSRAFGKAADDFLLVSELAPSDGRSFAAAAYCCVQQALDQPAEASSMLPLPALLAKSISLSEDAERAGFRSREMRFNVAKFHALLGSADRGHALLKDLAEEGCGLAEVHYLLALREVRLAHAGRRTPDASHCVSALELGREHAEVHFVAACMAACQANFGDATRSRAEALAHWRVAVERGIDERKSIELLEYDREGGLVKDLPVVDRTGSAVPDRWPPCLLDPLSGCDGPLPAR